MIRENQRLLSGLNLLADALGALLSMVLAYLVRFPLLAGLPSGFALREYLLLGLAAAPVCVLLYAAFGLYESFRTSRFTREFGKLFAANLILSLLLTAFFFVVRWEEFSRLSIVFFFLIDLSLAAARRFALRRLLRRHRARGHNRKTVLLVGGGRLAREYLAAVRADPELGFEVCGYAAAEPGELELPYLGNFGAVEALVSGLGCDELVAALEMEDYGALQSVIEACESAGVKLSVIPFYSKFFPARPYIDEIDGIPLINLRRIPLDNLAHAFFKRALDICGSLALLALLSPVLLVTAVGVKLSSPGPVIFRQTRVGLGKRNFTMYKFRSMRLNGDSESAWSRAEDSRRTRFGSLIRKCSIDELPQLCNVLRGDMSLVGPRPEIPKFVEEFRRTTPLYMVKHQVRPGITGWAQVNGYRGDTSIAKRIEYDIYYIENWTFLFDIKILLMTLGTGFINNERLDGNGTGKDKADGSEARADEGR